MRIYLLNWFLMFAITVWGISTLALSSRVMQDRTSSAPVTLAFATDVIDRQELLNDIRLVTRDKLVELISVQQ